VNTYLLTFFSPPFQESCPSYFLGALRHISAKLVTIQVGTEEQREMKTYRDLQVWQKNFVPLCLCAFVPE
jgi:hypothetical protein